MEQHSQLSSDVLQILRQESGNEPTMDIKLDVLFAGKDKKFVNAIIRIEEIVDTQLCKDVYIEWLRTRTVEFILRALDSHNEYCQSGLHTQKELSYSDNPEADRLDRRDALIAALCVSNYGRGFADEEQEIDFLNAVHRDGRIWRVILKCRKYWNRLLRMKNKKLT